MAWTTLRPLDERPWHQKATAQVRDALNRDIAKLLDDRARLDDQAARVLAQDPADADADSVFRMDVPKIERFEALQAELRVRRRLSDFWRAEALDREAEFQRALAALEKTREQIYAGLRKLGYLETDSLQRGRILPGYINDHPAVIEATGYAASLQPPSTDPEAANGPAQARVLDELSKLRTAAVAR